MTAPIRLTIHVEPVPHLEPTADLVRRVSDLAVTTSAKVDAPTVIEVDARGVGAEIAAALEDAGWTVHRKELNECSTRLS